MQTITKSARDWGLIQKKDKEGNSVWYARITRVEGIGKKRQYTARAENKSHARRLRDELIEKYKDNGEKAIGGVRLNFRELAEDYKIRKLIPAKYHQNRKVLSRRGRFAAVHRGLGMNGDMPTPGDYDNDGKTDLAIFRPSTGTWWIARSSDNTHYTVYLGFNGAAGDLTAQADFDGDGKTDPAIFRPSTQYWYIIPSSTGSLVSSQFGGSGDKPAAADYDADGKADLAVWRDSEAKFYTYSSNLSQQQTQTLGTSGNNSAAVPGDYDGDTKADYAIRSGNDWIIRQSSDGQTQTVTWYLSTDRAVQNDYDGDGKVDIATWRPSGKGAGNWYIRNSHDGSTRIETWGSAGDIPVPALFRR